MAFKAVTIWMLIVGIIASTAALNSFIEATGPALFVLYLSLGLMGHWLWDRFVLKEIDTSFEIENGNVAYALYNLVPALLAIAAAIASVG